jgi:SAM-dependent methyltransferase
MSLHHSFYDIYSKYLFDNFECYNVCVINQDITKHFQELADFAELRDGHSVLDMGCGNGQFLNFLDKKFNNIQTLGIDPSNKQIAIARNHGSGPSYKQGDSTNFKSTQKYDRIFFNESIGYNKDRQYPLLHQYHDLLNPGGFLIISTLTKHNPLRGFNFDKISQNYKQIFEKHGHGLQVLLAVSGQFEYQRMDFNYIKKYFKHSVFEGTKVVQKKWLTKRPDIGYTKFFESELLRSHVIFKVYGPKEKKQKKNSRCS